jgi:hypothetical protein
VQALPSLQLVPFALAGFVQMPVAGAHTPTPWHWSEAVHVTGVPDVQTPSWQVSDCVHALPSVHAEPSDLGGLEQAPVAVSQTPTWH